MLFTQLVTDVLYPSELTHESDMSRASDWIMSHPGSQLRRVARDSKDAKHKVLAREHHEHPWSLDSANYFTTPRVFNGSLLVHNPLYPLRAESYAAYTIVLIALVLFCVGALANLAVSCSVWHNQFLQSTRNCVLASLALWDLTVIFFCLPIITFHQITKRRLLGDASCRLVPFIQV